jgi:AcrR family transcriptional regulator
MQEQENNIPNKPKGSAEIILEAAADEFAEFGLAGARVDRIAARANINKAMIYYHFGSKEKLYQAVIDDHVGRIAAFAAAQDLDAADLTAVIEKIAGYMNALFGERRSFAPIFLREAAAGGDRLRDSFVRFIRESGITARFKSLIEYGQAAGQFREIDAKHAIASFIGMNIFYQLMAPVINRVWEIEDEDKFRSERPKAVVDLFLHGLLK